MIKNFFKGIFIGITDTIPGISGATIALITGIYEKIVKELKKIISIKSVKDFLKLDFLFLFTVGLGLLAGLISMIFFLDFALLRYPQRIYGFFLGVILGSSFLLLRQEHKKNHQKWVFLGVLTGLIITSLSVKLTYSPTALFISGFLATTAMLLPGISGSYVLLILGQYERVVHIARNALDNLGELFLLVLGAFVALVSLISTISYLINNYRSQTFLFLIGLMLGGLIMVASIAFSYGQIFQTTAFAVIGIIISVLLYLFR